jgi:hypothetical protein
MNFQFEPTYVINLIAGMAAGVLLLSLFSESAIKPLRVLSLIFLVFILGSHFKTDLLSLYDRFMDKSTAEMVSLPSGKYFVSAKKLNVRIAPSNKGEIVTSLERGNEVYVYESKNGWARVSGFHDGAGYKKSGDIAQWVSASYLDKQRPQLISPVIDSSSNYPSEPVGCKGAKQDLRDWEDYMRKAHDPKKLAKQIKVARRIGAGGQTDLGGISAGMAQAEAKQRKIQEQKLRDDTLQKSRLQRELARMGCDERVPQNQPPVSAPQSKSQSKTCAEAKKTLRDWDAHIKRNFSSEVLERKRNQVSKNAIAAGGGGFAPGNIAKKNFDREMEAVMRENTIKRLEIVKTISSLGCD